MTKLDTIATMILASAETFAAICGQWESAAEAAANERVVSLLPGASAIRSAQTGQIIAVDLPGVGSVTLSDAKSLAQMPIWAWIKA